MCANTTWLQGILSPWKTPTFATCEATSNRASDVCVNRSGIWSGSETFPESGMSEGSESLSVSKRQLDTAVIVGQVDKKFVLCKILEQESQASHFHLVLFDQHAVSERIVFERLLENVVSTEESRHPTDVRDGRERNLAGCSQMTRQPTSFELPQSMGQKLPRYASQRGMSCKTRICHGSSQASIAVTVENLPVVIAAQCRSDPAAMSKLIFLRNGQPRTKLSTERDDHAQGRHSGILAAYNDDSPPRLLELLRTRACRSAVMFNDSLSKTECEDLVKNLSNCEFPFFCAHGRLNVAYITSINANLSNRRFPSSEPGGLPERSFVLETV